MMKSSALPVTGVIVVLMALWSCRLGRKESLMTDREILGLIGQMTLEEKVSMVHG